MKTILALSLVLFALPAHAASPQQIRSTVETKWNSIKDAFAQKMETYRISKGRYLQILKTHKNPPADGAETAPDNLDAKPHYQTDGFASLDFTMPATLPMCVEVLPSERGYMVILTFKINGKLQTQIAGFGELSFMTTACVEEFL